MSMIAAGGSELLAGRRIAILVQNLPVPFDRRVWQEATALVAAGAAVTVVSPDGQNYPPGQYVIDGVTVHRYANPPEARGVLGYFQEYGTSLRRMGHELRKARQAGGAFDAIHFCNPPDLLYRIAKPYRRRDGTKLIFDQHDLGPELAVAKGWPALLRWVARFFESRTYAAADHVIATNESYKSIAVSRGGFRPADVTVVRSAPSAAWPDSDFPRTDHHQGAQYLLGYLGVMGRQEGIEYLLEAMRLLIDQGLDVRLSLVGSGPDRARLESLAAQLGVGERTTFHGRLPDDDMKSVLRDADVCVNPDEVNPMNDLSTMNKIVEYMALGRPIVQFDVREGRFSAQSASLYADANDARSFADKIAEVLTNPTLARQMAEAGRQRFHSDLAWERQGMQLVDAYQRVLAG